MSFHYVYYSYEEWGRGYIGSRRCTCSPENDIRYFGSFRDKSFKPTHKIILGIFNTGKESLAAERQLMEFFSVGKNPHFANQQQKGSGAAGWKHTEEHKQMMKQKMTKRKFSEETRRKMSESAKARCAKKEWKEKQSKVITAINKRKEVREKRRAHINENRNELGQVINNNKDDS